MALVIRPADKIKVIIIEYLLKHYPDAIVGSEVMYGTSRKVVDLLALIDGETYAIEVKSEKDDIRLLPTQLENYSTIFDHTIICTHPKHSSKIQSICPPGITILEVIDDSICIRKCSSKRNRTTKQELLFSISASFIRKHLRYSSSLSSDQIRAKAMRQCTKQESRDLFYSFLEEKIRDRFLLVLKERTDRISIDDLSLLSSRILL